MSADSTKTLITDTDQDNDEINLWALILVLLRGWKTLLFCTLLGLVIAILYVRSVNPTFKSDALIQIDKKAQGLSELGENISGLVGSQLSEAQTESELIKSRMILQPVVDLLHLDISLSDSDIKTIDKIKNNVIETQINAPEGVSIMTENGQAYISQFDVSPMYLNQPFTLKRADATSEFVLSNGFDEYKGQLNKSHQFRVADGVIQIKVEDLPKNAHPISVTKQSLQSATDSINSRLSVVEKGMQTGIIELSMTGSNQQQVSLVLKQIVLSYVNQNQSRGSEETTKTIAFMETQIPILKKQLEDSEAQFNEFRKKNGTVDVSKEAELLLTESSQIDVQLNELKLKKADLTTYYTEEHPLVVQINEQLKVLGDRKQSINDTIKELPEIQREFSQLSEDTAINREIYLTMLKNYEQLKIVKAGQIGYARIIDLPISTFKAIGPKKLQIMLIAMIVGAMLGTLLVLIKSLFRGVVRDPKSLEQKTAVPVIASVPRSSSLARLGKKKKSANRLLAYIDYDGSAYEAIKSLRTHLMFGMSKSAKDNQTAKVILLSSESSVVGKSFIVANLAEVFGHLNKKILVMDSDMRMGALHHLFNTEQNDGLADYLAEDTRHLSQTVHPTGLDNIDFMPRGQNTHNASSLLANDRFSDLMSELKAHYDYIILDSPPILAASDAIILAQHADQVLIVTRYNSSLEDQLVSAIKQMHKANVQVDGIILNDIQQGLVGKLSKHSRQHRYSYGHNK